MTEPVNNKFIYGLFELDSGRLRYIGQTISVRDRFCQHEAGHVASTCGWVCDLRNSGRDIYMKILARPSFENAYLSEIDFIRDAFLRGEQLLNRELHW